MDPEQFKLNLDLIPHVLENTLIHQRPTDGFVNATAMCQAANKQFSEYSRNRNTQDFLAALSFDMGYPISTFVIIVKGGKQPQGSWVHPLVAINLAMWCSPDFGVKVSQWVYEWMSGKMARPALPVHLRRYMKNRTKIPPDKFSILSEVSLEIVGPLEVAGYTVPENFGLDISAGRLFCAFLKEEGVDTDAFQTYRHEYEDHRGTVDAKLYPIEYVGDFRRFLRDVWLPLKAPEYFRKRDPAALPYLPKSLPPPDEKAA